MKTMTLIISTALATGLLSIATAQGQLVSNGAFDDTKKSFVPATSAVPAPQAQIAPSWNAPQGTSTPNLNSPDWDIVPGTFTPGYSASVPASSDGGHWMAMIGFDWKPDGESIAQPISGLKPGQRYRLEFQQIALPVKRQTPPLPSGVQNDYGFLRVSISGQTIDTPIEEGDSNRWRTVRLNFTANAANTDLEFKALDARTGNNWSTYLGIDGVSLRELDKPEVAHCIDLANQKPGAQYQVGNAIHLTSGQRIQVHDYRWANGKLAKNGYLEIDSQAPQSNETWIRANNANAVLAFQSPVQQVTFQYIDLGGSVNLIVNGVWMDAGDMTQFHGQTVNGVRIAAAAHTISGGHRGTVTLEGPIHKIGLGGQEFWFKSLCGE